MDVLGSSSARPSALAALWVVGAVALGLIGACEADEGESGEPPPPRSVTVEIEAAEGGEASLEGGARLVLPAGALAEDTAITLTEIPRATFGSRGVGPGVVAAVELTSDGLALEAPARLELPFDPRAARSEADLAGAPGLRPALPFGPGVVPVRPVPLAFLRTGHGGDLPPGAVRSADVVRGLRGERLL